MPLLLMGAGAVGLLAFLNKDAIEEAASAAEDAVVEGGETLLSTITDGLTRARAALDQAFDFTKSEAFHVALQFHDWFGNQQRIAQWSDLILQNAQRYGVNPWFLAGMLERESLGGEALTPKGPAGTGDFIPRMGAAWAQWADPATGLPNDNPPGLTKSQGAMGWGRGLGQIDYWAYNSWVRTHDWQDPVVNLDKATQILKSGYDFFTQYPGPDIKIEAWRFTTGKPQNNTAPWTAKYGVPLVTSAPDPRPLEGAALYEAIIAGYNAGNAGALQAIAVGLPADAATTGQDYSQWTLRKIAGWTANFT